MSTDLIASLASELNLPAERVAATAALLDDGATVPFIARYRKEQTGSLDEVAVTAIRDRLAQLRDLQERRETILASLDEQGVLSDDLRARIGQAATLSQLEDLYLPYRPKRRTRATMARERGLEPLADLLWEQRRDTRVQQAAHPYVDEGGEVPTVDDALAGARDILAERISEDAAVRADLRRIYERQGVFRTRVARGKEAEAQKYRDYFEWEEPVSRAPSHRVLAMRRGEAEKLLTLRIVAPEAPCLLSLERRILRGRVGEAVEQVRLALQDSCKRLLSPALETELRLETRKRADTEAIRVFAENLRQLLLAAPLGQRPVLALDPGLRTGCKLVCLSAQGELLHDDVIFPDRKTDAAAKVLRDLCARHDIAAVAIGNGTGGRETERFVRGLDLPGVQVVMVNEAGASVYSASEAAREEFPDKDLTVRGSVSIGRRLMDPLAELVKIDPKSIGVGQYQHDVDQTALKASLDDVVVSCVNSVGVELNSASGRLLAYVSGLSTQLADNIVAHRAAHGPFRTRKALLDVSRLGPKAFEQAAGFLRIGDGEHPLDGSAVHPERYSLVERMARDAGCTIDDLLARADLRDGIDLERYIDDDTGRPTLQDILAELARPGRDPRDEFESVEFLEGVETMQDLEVGMVLPGVVTNITAFGAFVDVGVHQDGLVHISQLADRYVRDPNEVVHVAQAVQVRVLSVDLDRRRIGLSMRSESPAA
jgi:uncharacterized protein